MKLNHFQVLNAIKKRCLKNSNIKGLVVFGSYVFNKHTQSSDLDIIISLNTIPTSAQERNQFLSLLINDLEEKYNVDVNPILVEDNNVSITPLLIEIARYATIIIDKNKTFSSLFSQINHKYAQKDFQRIQKKGYEIIQVY